MVILVTIAFSSVPFQLEFKNAPSCEINDGSGTDCQAFIYEAASIEECYADVRFNFTFTNIGLGCVDVSGVSVTLGPFGKSLLTFDDIYSYKERQLCVNETWTVPDRRLNLNLCEASEHPWDIIIEVNEARGQTSNNTYVYEWVPYSASKFPSASPVVHPSAVPSIDTCADCTLTGVVSGGKSLHVRIPINHGGVITNH